MNKQSFITGLSCILDRGLATLEDTAYFSDRKHDALLDEFCYYLELHHELVGTAHLELTQALNDRGTDLLLKVDDIKVGFQIKSHHDVIDPEFSRNVKRQMTESFAHDLDKWILLICCPLGTGGKLGPKVAHLVNELSTLKIAYHAVYAPRNTIQYFNGAETIDVTHFNIEMQRRSYERTPIDSLICSLEELQVPRSAARKTIMDHASATNVDEPKNLKRLNEALGWSHDAEQLAALVPDIVQLGVCAAEARSGRIRWIEGRIRVLDWI